MRLAWFGDAVYANVVQAAKAGMRDTIGACVADAKAETPVLTGAARDSVHAEEGRSDLDVTWGGHVPYYIWIEIGAYGRPGRAPLRRSADANYGRLGANIARHLL